MPLLIRGIGDLFSFVKELQSIARKEISKKKFQIVSEKIFELTPDHVWRHYQENGTPLNIAECFRRASAPCVQKFKKMQHLVIGYTLYYDLKYLWRYWIKFRIYNLTAIRYLLACKADTNLVKLELKPIDIELIAFFGGHDDSIWNDLGEKVYNVIIEKYNALRYH